jgi:hypothetical protein
VNRHSVRVPCSPGSLATTIVVALIASAGCERSAPAARPPDTKALAPAAPTSAAPAAPSPTGSALAKVEPTTQPIDRPAAERAIARLAQQLAVPAGDPENPWALAHGLLAFGRDFQTRDGRSALLVAASYAQPEGGPKPRYDFPLAHGGKPVEPHSYLLVKTFLELGLAPSFTFTARDGAKIDVRRLLTDMRASLREPKSDAEWHDAAWWLSALELHPVPGQPDLARLREAALVRLEADDAVLVAEPADPFAPSAPMGAAKRSKSHIYGHPCGGLHFVQAVLRGASATRDAPVRARVHRQLALLLRRYEAERTLYADTLRAQPGALLLVSGQQLKFFGHLLETLALADELGVLRDDAALAGAVTAARRRAASDLLRTLSQLEQERAYLRLPELSAQRPQLALDLVGDGCHALHGLRVTLPVLHSP